MSSAMWLADTWGMHGEFGWGWMIVMMGGMVLFWGVVIFGIVWLIRSFERSGPRGGERTENRESPLEILDRRFAEGAITPEDYRVRREVLTRGYAEPNGAFSDASFEEVGR